MRLLLVLLLWLASGAGACGPGRGGGVRRKTPHRLLPLVFKQHIPNVGESSYSASGVSERRISRHDERFRDLVPNYNADIIFKDEEGTGADRLMTQRCKERLNTLAISVMNQWPGVKLRVTEGWDEEGLHSADSLHYEGRAVDVTTSDRDRAKYGMLARLAVEAGFDWVYYESRAHIHCSVRSESSQIGKSGGCFPGDATVQTSDGRRLELRELRLGDRILSMDLSTGQFLYSEVILFLDRSPEEEREFLTIRTASGRELTVTRSHLLPVRRRASRGVVEVFAERVREGDLLLARPANASSSAAAPDRVVSVRQSWRAGVYAPLTVQGTLVVDGVAASCYAVVDSQRVAHWSFAPIRFFAGLRHVLGRRSLGPAPQGVHWYARMLYAIARFVLPSRMIYT